MEKTMDYVFNQEDLKKSVIEQDDMAVAVLWDKNKKEFLAATRLTMQPHQDDQLVAQEGDDIVPVHKFTSGAVAEVGVEFNNQAELCQALTKKYGGFINQRKTEHLYAA
jgi:hypothetical protein